VASSREVGFSKMTNLETYIKQFSRLNRAPGQVWADSTRKRAPHTPILLLAVLDLVARGVITSPFIAVAGDLVELNELFNLYWRRIIPLGQTSSIAFPFSRLHNEPFWELVPQPGKEISPAAVNNITSVNQLRTLALGSRIDEDLFRYMQEPAGRNCLRETLVRSCFSEDARTALEEQAGINAEAFSYSVELAQKAHLPLVAETRMLGADVRVVCMRLLIFRISSLTGATVRVVCHGKSLFASRRAKRHSPSLNHGRIAGSFAWR
jgi:putative restriction endonuclease